MTFLQGGTLLLAGMLAGALNAIAGGGSFFSFPTLLFVGVPAIPANATSATALLPGSLASIPPYRADLAQEKREVLLFSVVSAVGGGLGAILLAKTPPAIFEGMIPYLMLLATVIFAAGGKLGGAIRRLRGVEEKPNDGEQSPASLRTLTAVLAIQFILALYGGFFGAGVSIMILAVLSLLGMTHIHAMNALKVLLASVTNSVAVVAFALLNLIYWPQAIVMAIGAALGGWGGATLAHFIPPRAIRWFVIAVGLALSLYFFLALYLSHR
jgi:uncharacterized protein